MANPNYQLVDKAGKIYRIGPRDLTLGRDPASGVVLPGSQVSLVQARILLARGRCWIREERSSIGIFVNGQRVQGQQELRLGDTLQIGTESFRLMTVAETKPAHVRQRKTLVLFSLVVTGVVLFVLILGSGGLLSSTPSFTYETAIAVSPTVLPLEESPTAPPTFSTELSVAIPSIIATTSPSIGATISCENMDAYIDIHTCKVVNTGSNVDTLWIYFSPFWPAQTNDFNLSILMEGEVDALFPDRKGNISLGPFDPNSEKEITLRMYCVDTVSGCPETKVQVQLLADNGNLAITGPRGEFDLKNAAYVVTATPTRKAPREDSSPTDLPATSLPTSTSTPSDALGPTPTPKESSQ